MKTIKIFVPIFVFALLFGSQKMSIAEPQPLQTTFDEIAEEFEEYPVEDYFEGTYLDTECQDCLASVESNGCLEEHLDCLELPDCSDWLSCVGWCDAYEGDDDCYLRCDYAFIDKKEVEVDLHSCTCEMCSIKCRVLCGVKEGY